jgi:ADP-heptose:LPS heptosyltransferase
MRRADSAFGIPLCFLLTFVRKTAALFACRNKVSGPVCRILLIKLSEMGAITLTFPLISFLKKEYPGAEISFLVFEKNASAMKPLKNAVDPKNVYPVKDDSFWAFIASSVSALVRIRRRRFDLVLDLEFFSRCTSVMAYLAGGKKSVGFYRYNYEGLYRGDLLTHKVQYNPLMHCSRSYLTLGKAAKLDSMERPSVPEPISDEEMVFPRLDPQSGAIERMRARLNSLGVPLENLFLIHPGDGLLPIREWPIENFIGLARRILQDPRNTVVIVGRDYLTGKDVIMQEALKHPRCINMVDKTDFEELIALFHTARTMATNDCGLPHLASHTPIKRVVIFGPESPAIFAPVGKETRIVYSNYPCSPCLSALNHRESSCCDNLCLKRISLDEVYEAVMSSCG